MYSLIDHTAQELSWMAEANAEKIEELNSLLMDMNNRSSGLDPFLLMADSFSPGFVREKINLISAKLKFFREHNVHVLTALQIVRDRETINANQIFMRKFLTKQQAIDLLGKRKEVHTFRSGTGILIGADHSRKSLLESINNADEKGIEIGGDMCKKMGHGLVIWTSKTDPLFVEVDNDKLELLEQTL